MHIMHYTITHNKSMKFLCYFFMLFPSSYCSRNKWTILIKSMILILMISSKLRFSLFFPHHLLIIKYILGDWIFNIWACMACILFTLASMLLLFYANWFRKAITICTDRLMEEVLLTKFRKHATLIFYWHFTPSQTTITKTTPTQINQPNLYFNFFLPWFRTKKKLFSFCTS